MPMDARHNSIESDLPYRTVPGEVGDVMAQVRGLTINYLHDLVDLGIPAGRDWAIGYTHVEEGMAAFIRALAKTCEKAE